MGQLQLGPLDLARRVTEACAVMAAAFSLDDRQERERAMIFERHASRPGLIAWGAFTPDDRLAAFCYGFPGEPGTWWDEQVRPHMLTAGTADWLTGSFELTELHVHPDHQGHGIGRQLITTVCNAAPQPHAVLSVLDHGDSPARRLYSSLGFTDLTAPFRFVGFDALYRVMGAPLPLPT